MPSAMSYRKRSTKERKKGRGGGWCIGRFHGLAVYGSFSPRHDERCHLHIGSLYLYDTHRKGALWPFLFPLFSAFIPFFFLVFLYPFFFRLPRSGAPFLTANQSILGMCIVELVDYCILLYVRQGLEQKIPNTSLPAAKPGLSAAKS